MKKRLLSMILSLCLVLSLLPAQAFAAERLSYVALGDSITTGYGLNSPTTESFAALLAEKGNFALTNLAEDGETTETLLQTIQNNSTGIKKADVITITIGGNDLMNVLYDFLMAKYNADETNPDDMNEEQIKKILQSNDADDLQKKQKLLGYLSDENNIAELKSAISEKISSISSKFSTIITSLKILNPNTTIIVATQYNPYKYALDSLGNDLPSTIIRNMVEPIVSLFDEILEQFNALLSSSSVQHQYYCADVYTKFAEATANPCNASFTTFNLDFHPNAYGHKLIAETMSEYALQYSISVTPDTLTFDTATEGYTDSKAQTVTITNTGNQEVTVDLPTGAAYIITAKDGFSNGKATLAVNGQATFTVRPKAGLAAGTYKETIAVTGSNDITENITATFTVEEKKAVPTQPGTENQNPAQSGIENQVPQAGAVLQDTATGDIYKVTESGKEVEYVKSGSKSKKTEKIPATVTINGIRYTVTFVANNAFKNNKKVENVVIGKNVTKIGKKAFYGCKNLKKITIKSTKLKKKTIGAKAFTKAGSKNYSKLKVIVPKKCLKNYTKILKQKGLSKRAVIK